MASVGSGTATLLFTTTNTRSSDLIIIVLVVVRSVSGAEQEIPYCMYDYYY